MAQSTADRQLNEKIDWCLGYQWKAWSGVPWWANAWPEMEDLDREVFELEWIGITESWLDQLHDWADHHLLTPEQQRRFAELTQLVAEQRPTVQALLADDAAPLLQAPVRNV